MATKTEIKTREDFSRFTRLFNEMSGQVDTLQDLYDQMQNAKKVYEAAKKAYDDRLKKEISERVTKLDLDFEVGLEISGVDYSLVLGKARDTATCKDPVLARKLLNKVEKGLGDRLARYTQEDLKRHLPTAVVEELLEHNFGARTVSFKVHA